MDKPKILAISGSLRKHSKNTILLREAIEVFGSCSHKMGQAY